MTITSGRRTLAIALSTAVAGLGVASVAQADTGSAGQYPGGTTTTTTTGGQHVFMATGVFKTLFSIFGAVHTATPGIAAPIISQAVTAGTITQDQADDLTALFAATPSMHGGFSGFKSFDPAELTVLSQVMQAVSAQLPTIAAPVIADAVTAGDITQAQADRMTKVIAQLATFKPMSFGAMQSTATAKLGTVKKHHRRGAHR